MKSIKELNAIKEKILKRNSAMQDDKKISVTIGMATCGIAAGARSVMTKLLEELDKRSIKDVKVTQTGCVGMCMLEPLVDIVDEKGHKVTYVKVTPQKIANIVNEHIVNGVICSEYTIDKEKLGE